MQTKRETNLLLVRHVLLPTIFLTVALLGGLRIDAASRALVFVAPPLVVLVLAALLMSLFVRGGLVRLGAWLSADRGAAENVSHALVLAVVFFASAQAFNSVLPEAGLFRWLFSFFFLWTLWQTQFAVTDARRTLRSLAALFGTAFVLKHLLIAALYDPEAGWLRRAAAALFEGVTEGTVGGRQAFAPSTGYVSFFALALYILGLALLPPAPDEGAAVVGRAQLVGTLLRLPPRERDAVREALTAAEGDAGEETEGDAGENEPATHSARGD
jgi:hypothetical protein